MFTLVVLLDVVEVGTVVLLLVVEPAVLLLDEELTGSGAVGLCESQLATTTSPAKHMASSANAVKDDIGDCGVRDDSACLVAIAMTLPANSRNSDSHPPAFRG